jgi:hypothetical protein
LIRFRRLPGQPFETCVDTRLHLQTIRDSQLLSASEYEQHIAAARFGKLTRQSKTNENFFPFRTIPEPFQLWTQCQRLPSVTAMPNQTRGTKQNKMMNLTPNLQSHALHHKE